MSTTGGEGAKEEHSQGRTLTKGSHPKEEPSQWDPPRVNAYKGERPKEDRSRGVNPWFPTSPRCFLVPMIAPGCPS